MFYLCPLKAQAILQLDLCLLHIRMLSFCSL